MSQSPGEFEYPQSSLCPVPMQRLGALRDAVDVCFLLLHVKAQYRAWDTVARSECGTFRALPGMTQLLATANGTTERVRISRACLVLRSS